jgi:hypothetical protein
MVALPPHVLQGGTTHRIMWIGVMGYGDNTSLHPAQVLLTRLV